MKYGVYQTPDNTPDVMVQYLEMYKEIREALDNVAPTWNVDVGRGYFKKGLKSK